ncbi:MAG: hypothetical protein K8S23_16610 [Candidatus Cloacimonetes bacterium]|nr:hypothetical protein [Candidatus Cloacimonadota bacterium]
MNKENFQYSELTGIPSKTNERLIKNFIKADLIEFKGESNQIGGYYLTEKMRNNIKKRIK